MPNWRKLIVSGSDAALNSLNVTSELTASGIFYPTVDGTDGQALVTDGSGNLTFGFPTNADDAEKVTFAVQNDFTSTLQKGTPIHITSTTNGTSLVIPASASDASTMPAHGILNGQLAVGVDGEATIIGQITGVNTSAFSSGDTVYVGPNGGYTNVKPQGSGNLIQNLGVVKKVDASNGTGEIFGSGRSNDVPNLPTGKIWVGSSTYSVTSSVAHLDETNERLGINTNTPGASLDIIGDISGSTTLTIGSGHSNSGTLSSIAGGTLNTASADCSFIGGGYSNFTAGSYTTIGGGRINRISGSVEHVTIGGGYSNIIVNTSTSDFGSTIAGGYQNCIQNTSGATIGGGYLNLVTAEDAAIAGGAQNTLEGTVGFIGAGCLNTICSGEAYAVIGGGRQNTVDGDYSSIVGGTLNTASAACSFIGGGCLNYVVGNLNTVTGGQSNKITNSSYSYRNFIGGGCLNLISAYGGENTIAGGKGNTISGYYSQQFIGGGLNNTSNSSYSSVVGGCDNCVTGTKSVIVGGQSNTVSTYYSFIGAGLSNSITGTRGIIVGGNSNTNSAYDGFIGGGNQNCASANCSVIVGGTRNCVTGTLSSIAGGTLNTGSGACSFIGGGASNTAAGTFSYAGGELSCASGAQSFAHGYTALASGGASSAFGALTQATGNNSFAIGSCTQATQTDSFASGFDTRATGCQSAAFGYQTCANGNSSLAGGGVSCAIGTNSFAWGTANKACGTNSFAIGCFNIACNNQSFVTGFSNCIGASAGTTNTIFGASNCIATGQNNFLVGGTGCVSVGSYNFIGGQCNSVLNDIDTTGFATVFGCRNCANGRGSFSFTHGLYNNNFSFAGVALGQGSSAARGDQQFVFGCCVTNPNNGTTANISNSTVIGRYNVWNISDCHLFAVGDGLSDGTRTNALNVSSNGRTGLGCTSPQTRLDVNGTTRTTALVETSARRYKENIVSLQDQLDNIKKLDPVEFEWKETKKKDIGLIAEDVEKVYPHLVEHDDNGDLMGVKYSKITSLLIKAVQEQQQQIDELKKEIFILKQQG